MRNQFTIRDLVWSISLLSIGLACAGLAVRNRADDSSFDLLAFFLPPFAGAGVGALSQRKLLGFVWGILIAAFLFPFVYPAVPQVRE